MLVNVLRRELNPVANFERMVLSLPVIPLSVRDSCVAQNTLDNLPLDIMNVDTLFCSGSLHVRVGTRSAISLRWKLYWRKAGVVWVTEWYEVL